MRIEGMTIDEYLMHLSDGKYSKIFLTIGFLLIIHNIYIINYQSLPLSSVPYALCFLLCALSPAL